MSKYRVVITRNAVGYNARLQRKVLGIYFNVGGSQENGFSGSYTRQSVNEWIEQFDITKSDIVDKTKHFMK